jgi:hypothetical protein
LHGQKNIITLPTLFVCSLPPQGIASPPALKLGARLLRKLLQCWGLSPLRWCAADVDVCFSLNKTSLTVYTGAVPFGKLNTSSRRVEEKIVVKNVYKKHSAGGRRLAGQATGRGVVGAARTLRRGVSRQGCKEISSNTSHKPNTILRTAYTGTELKFIKSNPAARSGGYTAWCCATTGRTK